MSVDGCFAMATRFGDGVRVRENIDGESGLGTSSGDVVRPWTRAEGGLIGETAGSTSP